MSRISTLQEYKNSLSFSELCNYFLELTYGELKKVKGEKKFIIGYHIRHFLDSDAPTYLAKPNDEIIVSPTLNLPVVLNEYMYKVNLTILSGPKYLK